MLRGLGVDTARIPAPAIDRATPKIRPPGIDSTIAAGTPHYVRWRRFVTAEGIGHPSSPASIERVRLLGGYNPPPGGSLVINWFGEPYSVPPGSSLKLEFGALGYGYVWPAMGVQTLFGGAGIKQPIGIQPAGIQPGAFGTALLFNSTQAFSLTGWDAARLGQPDIILWSRQIFAGVGASRLAFGDQTVYLRDHYVATAGSDAAGYGSLRAEHAIRTLLAIGVKADAYGIPLAGNADRALAPAGIDATFAAVQHKMFFNHSRA